jgi:hypothetical protein
LFDEKEVIKWYGADSVVKMNQVFKFRNQIFKNGLLELDVPFEDLVQKIAEPTAAELYEYGRFTTEGHTSVSRALSRIAETQLRKGDRIKVVSEERRGAVGYLVDVGGDKVTIQVSNAS